MRDAFARSHDIHAIPEAIDEIYVSATRRPEHDFGSRRATPCRVGCEVLGSQVGFCFDYATNAVCAVIGMHQVHADELTGDEKGVFARVERAW
jgi:hypothetical protein